MAKPAKGATATALIAASDGVGLHVRSVGAGAPLLFVHEFSGDARSWDPQLNFFSRYYRCTAYCARGYPPSDVPAAADSYSQPRAADDLADVIEAVGGGPAHVVGLSMGGFAALHCGMRRPDLIRSLVLGGVGYGAKPEGHADYGRAMKAQADHAEALGMPAFARELAASGYAQCLRAKNDAGWSGFAAELAAHSVLGMAMTLRGVLGTRPSLWHLAEDLSRLEVPTLLLTGDEDTPCIEPSLFLKATLPDAALGVIPRSGHLINLEEPALFNSLVFGFLAAVETGRWTDWKGAPPHSTQHRETGSE